VNNLSGVVLNATDKAGKRTLAVSTAAIFNILVNLMFIPVWGYRGAVVSTLITELVLTIVLRRVLRPLSPSFLKPLLEGAAIAVLIGITVAVTPGHVFLRAGLGVAVFAALYALAHGTRRIAGSFDGRVVAQGQVRA
jgi:O-antigen/teichoic acid export membrane protein